MRRVLYRLGVVRALVLPLPVVVGLVATNAYAMSIGDDGTGCYELGAPVPGPTPGPHGCVLTVRLDGAHRTEVRVHVQTVDGTAFAREDYLPLDEMLTIPAGELTASVRLEIVPDDRPEPDERFTVLFEVFGEDLSERAAAEVTILDGGPPERLR